MKRSLSFLQDIDPEELRLATPRYNIAPSQQVACIRYNECVEPLDEERRRHLVLKQWGFLPSWAKDSTKVKPQINARGETVTTLPTFRSAYHKRRCVVLADGFYEWRKEGTTKQPYYFFLQDHRPFGFAGIWSRCQLLHDHPVETVAIITTEANPFMQFYHGRMPVMLEPTDWEWWLRHDQHHNTQVSPRSLLQPYQGNDLMAVPVSRAVNNPRNDGRSLIEAER